MKTVRLRLSVNGIRIAYVVAMIRDSYLQMTKSMRRRLTRLKPFFRLRAKAISHMLGAALLLTACGSEVTVHQAADDGVVADVEAALSDAYILCDCFQSPAGWVGLSVDLEVAVAGDESELSFVSLEIAAGGGKSKPALAVSPAQVMMAEGTQVVELQTVDQSSPDAALDALCISEVASVQLSLEVNGESRQLSAPLAHAECKF